MNKLDIKKLFADKQNQMLGTFGLTTNILHAGEKGDATADEWIKWFNDYFPKRYNAVKGFVIDCSGSISDQIDIIIYDTFYSPIVFEVEKVKYIAVESVYAVFEVKQKLNKEHFEYAMNKVASVRKLQRTNGFFETVDGGRKKREPLPQIIGGLLTLRCEWNLENIDAHIRKHACDIDPLQCLDFICCLENYACEIKNEIINHSLGSRKTQIVATIIANKNNGTLIYTYYKLLRMLQFVGNAPAIEYSKYGIDE